jgi:hypothetical protein
MSRSKITHHNLCVACTGNINLDLITAIQPGIVQVPDTEIAGSLQVNVEALISGPASGPTAVVEQVIEAATSANLTYGPGGTVSTITETETRNKMLTPTENVPLPLAPSATSTEDEAALNLKETSRWGRLRNIPKRQFIGECVCGSPVTVEEMDDQEKTICCKQKGCETGWVSQSGFTCQ